MPKKRKPFYSLRKQGTYPNAVIIPSDEGVINIIYSRNEKDLQSIKIDVRDAKLLVKRLDECIKNN